MHHRHTRKGQISIEMMFSIGVMLFIFILLAGVTFEKKVTVERLRESINKQNDCYVIANAFGRVSALGDGYSVTFKSIYIFDIFDNGLVMISDELGVVDGEQEIVCTYSGLIDQEYLDNTGIYTVTNINNQLTLTAET